MKINADIVRQRLDVEDWQNNIDYGEELLDEYLKLPRRGQAALFAYLLKENISISDFLCLYGNIDYPDCKSPIEKIFAFSYELLLFDLGFPECELIALYAQQEILVGEHKYYADFLINSANVGGIKRDQDIKLIVECDGHEFHEKTKEQVAQRNERDYNLKMAGYDILHFSGSEIYKNPFNCAMQTIIYAVTKIGSYEVD